MAAMVDESESSSPRCTLANPHENDEGVRSSSGGEEEAAPVAPSSVAGGVEEEEVEEADEVRQSLLTDAEESKAVEAAEPSRSLPPAEQDGAEDGKQGGTMPHPGIEIERHPSSHRHYKNNNNNKDLPPQEADPLSAAFSEPMDFNTRDSQRLSRAPPPCERLAHDDVAEQRSAPMEDVGIAEAWPSNFDEEQNINGNTRDVSQISTTGDLEEEAEARASAGMDEAAEAGVSSAEKDRAAARRPDGSPPFPADATGHEATDKESQESRVDGMPQEPTHSRPAVRGEEQEDHGETNEESQESRAPQEPWQTAAEGEEREDRDEEGPSTLEIGNPAATTTSRGNVGAFRIVPDGRRADQSGRSSRAEDGLPTRPPVQPVSEGNDRDDDLEATVVPMPEALLVDDFVVDGHPIHLTHVPISSIQQQRGENEVKDDDSFVSGLKKVFKKVSWGLLIICVAVAVGAGVNIGSKDKENVNVNDSLRGSQSEEEEVSSSTGEDEERVDSTQSHIDPPSHDNDTLLVQVMVSSSEGQEPLIASQDTETATGQTSSSTTTFAPTQANDISPLIWEQVGSNIPGVSAKDRAGFVVASSNDGKIIAISSPYNDDVATEAGHVRIFAWNHSANDWAQRGSTLFGEMEGDRFGHSVALSGSGDTVVCGAPFRDVNDSGQVKVFKWNETLADYVAWGSLHTHGRYTWDLWGWAVDISEDGLRVALSAPVKQEESFSFAMVLEWNATIMDWYPIGKGDFGEILGEHLKEEFGHSVSLSADGETFAVGAIRHNGASSEDVGKTRVFKWYDGVSDWVQLGSGIYGEAAGDWAGSNTDLSADGKVLAISAIKNDGVNGEESGHVRVYFWDELMSDWAQMGSDIDGKAEFDRFGQAVSLAKDGRTIAITSAINPDSGLRSGHCRVFRWSDSLQEWIQVGQDIQGEENDRTRGVALSGDGRTVVVGAWGVSGATGDVRVFNSRQWEGGEHDVFK